MLGKVKQTTIVRWVINYTVSNAALFFIFCFHLLTLLQIQFNLKQSASKNNNVRMAERSKAPDSRYPLPADSRSVREFWSSYEGVGSNPTSDKITFYTFLQGYCFKLKQRFAYTLETSVGNRKTTFHCIKRTHLLVIEFDVSAILAISPQIVMTVSY